MAGRWSSEWTLGLASSEKDVPATSGMIGGFFFGEQRPRLHRVSRPRPPPVQQPPTRRTCRDGNAQMASAYGTRRRTPSRAVNCGRRGTGARVAYANRVEGSARTARRKGNFSSRNPRHITRLRPAAASKNRTQRAGNARTELGRERSGPKFGRPDGKHYWAQLDGDGGAKRTDEIGAREATVSGEGTRDGPESRVTDRRTASNKIYCAWLAASGGAERGSVGGGSGRVVVACTYLWA